MALPVLIAAAAVGAAYMYREYYRNPAEPVIGANAEVVPLPRCCLEALNATADNGTLVAALGAFVATHDMVSKMDIAKPQDLQTTGKFVHDVGGFLVIDWDEEARKHTEFMQGVIVLTNLAAFNRIEEHFNVHKHDHQRPHVREFWTKLHTRKRARLTPKQRRENELLHTP